LPPGAVLNHVIVPSPNARVAQALADDERTAVQN